jgi:hypothetical protein
MAKVIAGSGMGGGLKKKVPIKVKQDMIDFIKTQGMTASLKRAGEIKASGKGGEKEFLEGVRRMYGAHRLAAATKVATPPKFKAPAGANKKPAGRMSKSAAPKKGISNSTGKKITAGVVGTAVAGAVVRGIAEGTKVKAAAPLVKLVSGAFTRKAVVSQAAISGMKAAKAGKGVTPNQLKAMKAAAKAAKTKKK